MKGLLTGPLNVVRAMGFLAQNPSLVKLALLPVAVTLLASIAGIIAVVIYGSDLVDLFWTPPESGPMVYLRWLAELLVHLALALLLVILVPWLVMLVGFPLCEPLAARTDALLGGPREGPAGDGMVREMARSVTGSVLLVAVGLAGAVALLLLGFLPGVGLVTGPFVALVWTPAFLALDLVDGPLGRRGLGLGERVQVLRKNPAGALSLGLAAGPLVAVPFLNLVGLPIAVVAGVLAVHDLERAGRIPGRSAGPEQPGQRHRA